MSHREKPLVIVVDDEDLIRRWLRESLTQVGYRVETAPRGADALRLVERTDPAVVLLDLRLPDGDGIELMPRLREIDPDLVVVMVTAYGEISTAVEAVKAGAYDFLEKPIDFEKLQIVIEKGRETRRLRQQIAVLREQNRWRFENIELVGRSSAMQNIVDMVEKVARADSPVLLRGESGTGKDLVARAVHARSARHDAPFIEINCTALPEHLAESELFGRERGAYTDAKERKKGLVELADGGSLFLDEMGDMAVATQAKLLRFLEGASMRRVGGTADISIDVRVIAATNRDLEALVAEGQFRSDLFFRLNVVPITIPPLRERREDVAPLALYFVDRLTAELRRDPTTLTEPTIQTLEAYDWPGNVRQLKNVLERVLILEEATEIRPDHLPSELFAAPGRESVPGAFYPLPHGGLRLQDVEADLIDQAMHRTNGNVTRAAALLGLTRDTLRYRLTKRGT